MTRTSIARRASGIDPGEPDGLWRTGGPRDVVDGVSRELRSLPAPFAEEKDEEHFREVGRRAIEPVCSDGVTRCRPAEREYSPR